MSATANHKSTRYIVISPVRDEAEYLDETIRSMVAQTVRPVQWIIVNDGSTDGTAEIIDRWAAEQPWIRAVHRENRGRREPGSGVIEAFYEGYEIVSDADWEYLVKLDGDLSFEHKYFEECFAEFDSDPALGIGGGVICHMFNGQLQVEPNPTFHVRGATKIYKRACWEQIVSLIRAPGWDTIDEVKANMLGWRTRSFREFEASALPLYRSGDGSLAELDQEWRGKLYIRIPPIVHDLQEHQAHGRKTLSGGLGRSALRICPRLYASNPADRRSRLDSLPSTAANPAPASKRQYLEVIALSD